LRCEEVSVEALRGLSLVPFSGHDRVETSAAWLTLVEQALPSICGEGARLSVIVAFDAQGVAAAIPAVRTEALAEARPFPMDVEDLFFGLWTRHVGDRDRNLERRAMAARLFSRGMRCLNRSLGRGLVLHTPLAPASDALVARRLSASAAAAAVRAALGRARAIAAEEDRCALLPRLVQRDAGIWVDALVGEGYIRASTYPSAELLLGDALPARMRQMIRRNARLVERAEVTVEVTQTAPEDMPFSALFAETASRHNDPAPRLSDGLFRAIGKQFEANVWFLSARRGKRLVGFVVAFARGVAWEAWKCGIHRAEAARAPVYLDLVYGKLPALAAREGGTRIELGAGQIGLKRRYGARVCEMEAYIALPPRFVGGGLFSLYVKSVGKGIARVEGVMDQVESVATTPK